MKKLLIVVVATIAIFSTVSARFAPETAETQVPMIEQYGSNSVLEFDADHQCAFGKEL